MKHIRWKFAKGSIIDVGMGSDYRSTINSDECIYREISNNINETVNFVVNVTVGSDMWILHLYHAGLLAYATG